MPFLINQRVKKLILTVAILILIIVPLFVVLASDVKNTYGTGLVSHWMLEEASGTRDDAHSTNDLTDNNTVTSATGKQGDAADFERGNSEYLSSTATIPSDVTSDRSISFWFKPESIPTTGNIHQLFSWYTRNGSNSFYVTLMHWKTGGGTEQFQILILNSSTVEDYVNVSLSAGTWYHIAMVCDAGTGYTLYLNGSSIKTGSCPTHNTAEGTGSSFFVIGQTREKNGTTYSRYIDGLVDEVSIWSRALSSGDVSGIYNSGNGIPYDEGGGGSSYDNTTLELVFW